MKKNSFPLILPILSYVVFVFFQCCLAQESNQLSSFNIGDKQPSVAGQFYPGNKKDLEKMLEKMFSGAKPASGENVLAVIAPHAGYVFSGEVAATSINQVDTEKEYKDIFIIGSSHYASYPSASLWSSGNFITPLGKVEVDTALAKKLIRENSVFTFSPDPYVKEHCIEVMLPLLQYKMKKPFRIVPVLIGSPSNDLCGELARVLKPYLTSDNLFIISTDFSHYTTLTPAGYIDNRTAQAIQSRSPDYLEKMVDNNSRKGIPGLVTSLCGYTSVMTLLRMIHETEGTDLVPLQYKNSGETPYGDTSRVVGYYSFSLQGHRKPGPDDFIINKDERTRLLQIARNTISEFAVKGTIPAIDTLSLPATLRIPAGAFVTIHKYGALRGCIGHFAADMPLWKTVQQMSVASSTEDYRFQKVSPAEIGLLEIEISVLSPLRKISSVNEIVMGKHGILIRKGSKSGTFLPQVAVETGWDKEEFISNCSSQKAGLGANGWKNSEIFVYEAKVFKEGK